MRKSNTVRVIKAGSWLKLLLDDRIVDMSRAICIETPDGATHSIALQASLSVATRTLLERGDPNYCFVSEVVVTHTGGAWRADSSGSDSVPSLETGLRGLLAAKTTLEGPRPPKLTGQASQPIILVQEPSLEMTQKSSGNQIQDQMDEVEVEAPTREHMGPTVCDACSVAAGETVQEPSYEAPLLNMKKSRGNRIDDQMKEVEVEAPTRENIDSTVCNACRVAAEKIEMPKRPKEGRLLSRLKTRRKTWFL